MNPPPSQFRERLRSLFPTCRDAIRLQSLAMEQPVTGTRRFGLSLHLFFCSWCRRYGKQIRFMRDAARERSEDLVNASKERLSPEARERIKRVLNQPPS